MTFNLKNSIEHVCKSIKNTPLREHNGVRYQVYENFFDKIFLQKLQETKSNKVKLERLRWQEQENRRLVNYGEPISKILQVLFHSSKILSALKTKYNLNSLRPNTTDMWFDYNDYNITPHIDGDYQMQLQIYLNDEKQPPTAFFEKDPNGKFTSDVTHHKFKKFDSAEYKSNYGYCLLNEGPSWHGMTGPMESGERQSIFARFE
jgi:hypothetical protein